MPGASLWSQLGGDASGSSSGRTDHDEPPRNVLIARQGADDLLVHMLIGPSRLPSADSPGRPSANPLLSQDP